MGMLRIHCDYCGQAWEVYHRDEWNGDSARTCPHCFSEIDPGTWEKVVAAFAEMSDANIELVKDHAQAHGALFTVDYLEDYTFRDRHAETLADIQNSLEDLRQLLQRPEAPVFVYDRAE